MTSKANNQERTPVRLKGRGNSLCLTVDPREPMSYLQSEVGRLLGGIRDLSAGTRVLIDAGEQEGCEELVRELTGFLKQTFGVVNVAGINEKENESDGIKRHKDVDSAWYRYRSDVLMLTGRVRSGQKVTARKHLLLLGGVNPGGEVIAGGDIIILGTLSGAAAAGQPEDSGAIVIALDFRPTQVQIGSYVAAGLPPSPHKAPEYAHVENDMIVVEDYLETDPFGRIPWPQVR